jgi:hypothetical protein
LKQVLETRKKALQTLSDFLKTFCYLIIKKLKSLIYKF